MKLSETQRARVRRLLGSNSSSFADLVRAAELDPGTDFREADLRRINFGSDDLSGFEFKGADLHGANLSQAKGVTPEMLRGASTDRDTLGFVVRDFPGGPEMVMIPPGIAPATVDMVGMENSLNSLGEPIRYKQDIAIGRPLLIGRYPVTQAEFDLFLAETGYPGTTFSANFVTQSYQAWRGPLPGSKGGWPGTGFDPGEQHPVISVAYEDAKEYALWASGKSGKEYFIPDERTWQYCARAGAGSRFYWGDDVAGICNYANIADQALRQLKPETTAQDAFVECNDGFPYLAPVGSLKPNAFGLYDTLGNVWEWCDDELNDLLIVASPAFAFGTFTGRASGKLRKVCGGSWATPPRHLGLWAYEAAGSDLRDNTVGFRVCRRL
jgi:sulfatase modifying factor 1